ncbi:TPA: hypothetical protein ACWP5B_002884 [Escherichia coli]
MRVLNDFQPEQILLKSIQGGQFVGFRFVWFRIFVVAKMGQNAVKGAKMGQQKCWLLWFIVVVDAS